MEQIKAIPTFFNGDTFRSRLEAKWAVFFTELKIKYIYETEGYEMSDGQRYLPDFFLPDLNYYVEVKGYNDHLIKDFERVKRFVLEKKTALMILSEIPYDPASKGLFWFLNFFYEAKSGGCITGEHCFFQPIDNGSAQIQDDYAVGANMKDGLYFPKDTPDTNKALYKRIQAKYGSLYDEDDECFSIKNFDGMQRIEEALKKARNAKFGSGKSAII